MTAPNPTARDIAALAPLVDSCAPKHIAIMDVEEWIDQLCAANSRLGESNATLRNQLRRAQSETWLVAVAGLALLCAVVGLLRMVGTG